MAEAHAVFDVKITRCQVRVSHIILYVIPVGEFILSDPLLKVRTPDVVAGPGPTLTPL